MTLLQALMSGGIPRSILERARPSGFWATAEEAARRVGEWEECRMRAADTALHMSALGLDDE